MGEDEERAETARWLSSPEAAADLAAARAALDEAGGDPLRAGSGLRRARPELTAPRAAAVLEQADLGRLARERYGIDRPLLLTRAGLEQGTRPEVSTRRARQVAASGARRVLDLTAGLGFDTGAFRAAGLEVIAVERDPVTAALLAANRPDVEVVVEDALVVLPRLLERLDDRDVVFVDPARRDPAGPRDHRTGRARPERDPERWSPSWSTVQAIPHPRVLAKVAPGFEPPDAWQAEWVSVDRTLVECSVASWELSPHHRAAVMLGGGSTTVVAVEGDPVPDAPTIGAWVAEPDPAVVRAGATTTLARHEGMRPLGPGSTWLTGDRASTSPALRCFLVDTELTGTVRQQRRALADRGVTRVTVKSRDVDVDPAAVLRSLGLREGPEHVLVMTRHAGRTVSLLAQPAAARDR